MIRRHGYAKTIPIEHLPSCKVEAKVARGHRVQRHRVEEVDDYTPYQLACKAVDEAEA